MASRRRSKRKRSSGLTGPKTVAANHPLIYVLPLIVIVVVGFLLFRPDPNIGDGEELKKANELDQSQTSIPEREVIFTTGSDGEPTIIRKADATGNLTSDTIILASKGSLTRNDGKLIFSNPLLGFWTPKIEHYSNPIRLRFTETFMCEIYVVINYNLPDSTPNNLKKIGEIPYKLEGTGKLEKWQRIDSRYMLPEISIVVTYQYTNRDGTVGENVERIPVPLKLITKGDATPTDVDDYVEYSFTSRQMNSVMLPQFLKAHNVPVNLSTQWVRAIEADWRDGVDTSQF